MVDAMAKWSDHGKLTSQAERRQRKMGRIAYGTEGNDVSHTLIKQDMETLLINGRNLVLDIDGQRAQPCLGLTHLQRPNY